MDKITLDEIIQVIKTGREKEIIIEQFITASLC